MSNKKGYFGEYGGVYAPENLMAPLAVLKAVLSKKILKSKNDYSPGELRQLGY
jgi:tryptophan synthase beta subunit